MGNNLQREAEASDNTGNEELLKLEDELREVAAAEQFFEQASGKLFLKVATELINQLTKDILSDKFEHNLAGYNNAKAKINAYKNMLRRMQVAASPVRKAKIQEKMGEADDNGQ